MEFDYSLEPGKELKRRYKTPGEEPLVSIITPYFNAGKYFEQTFNSVMNQTFPWYEWIIVNDGSTNEADVRFLEKFKEMDKRIRIYHKENGGAAGARNYGIQRSKTDVIIFLDADDLIDERYIEYVYFALLRNPDAKWAYSDSLGFQGQEYLWCREFSSEEMKKENILSYIAAIRKEVFTEDKLYSDESKNMWEDYQLWLKMLAKGYRPVHVEQVLFWYRRLESGELAKIEQNPKLKRELQKRINELAKEVPDGIRAITFRGNRIKEFEKPGKWKWERKLPFEEEKTRILMLIPHMECGGADKFNLDILKNINREKYEIGVITTVPAENEWRQEFTKYADDVFELPSFLDMGDWSGFIHYYIYSRDVKILWNISSYFGYYALPWLRTEFPELAIIDCVHAEGKYWRAGGYPRVSAALDSILEKTFVTNDYTRNILVEKYGKKREKTQVIYTGADETEFDPDSIDGSVIKMEYGISENRPVVLYLCRMAPEKRPFLMLEIAKEVKKSITDICFLAVGDGPQLDEMKKKAAKEKLQDTVYFTGRVDDAKPYYKVGDLFLLCSIKEGLSITTIEAMLMETPVVSADVGSQYELVTNETGRLIACRQDEEKDFDSRSFDREEILEYSTAICELLGDRAQLAKMGKACREKALNGFTLKVLMETLDREFTLLLNKESVEKRKINAFSMMINQDIFRELIAIYNEYESIQVDYRGAYKFMQYFIDVITFRRNPISIIKEVNKKKSPIVKRLIKKIIK